MNKNKTERPRSSFAKSAAFLVLLLLLAIVAVSASSCGPLRIDRGTETTTPVTTTSDTAVPPVTTALSLKQYHVPEAIPNGAGTYAYVAEYASPSVVSIITEAISYDKFYGSYVESGAGSGVIFHADDAYTYIITNNHVVEGYSTITVYTSDPDCPGYTAEVCGTDWTTDIAVVRIKATGLTPATLGNSTELCLGQEVAAIGNPLGTLGGTVTDGIIGCLERSISVEGVSMTLIQHSAGVSPGNSGGGLFNLYGQLIGIVNAKSSGSGVEAIGYAIPIDIAVERAVQLIERGYVSNTPFLGLSYSQSTSYGIVVAEYQYNAELTATNQDTVTAGDILTELDGVAITDVADLRTVLCSVEVGDTVEAVFLHPVRYNSYQTGYTQYTVNLKIHEYLPEGVEPPAPEPETEDPSGDISFN